MTEQNKQLLLKDLCARLPYGVKLNFYSAATKENYTCTLLGIEPNDDKSIIVKVDSGAFMFPAEHIKPYLRPMSSMTEEEENECIGISRVTIIPRVRNWYGFSITNPIFTDWLNAHHFDYRGLIPMGLALKAKKGMYEIKV